MSILCLILLCEPNDKSTIVYTFFRTEEVSFFFAGSCQPSIISQLDPPPTSTTSQRRAICTFCLSNLRKASADHAGVAGIKNDDYVYIYDDAQILNQ